MSKAHSMGCSCCCTDKILWYDDFTTTKPGYLSTSSRLFTVDSRGRFFSRLRASGEGSFYRQVDLGSGGTHNLRIQAGGQAYDTVEPAAMGTADKFGFFIGGLCCCWWESLHDGGNYRFKLGLNCDEFGDSPTEIIELGLGSPNSNPGMLMTIHEDGTDTGTYYVFCSGGTGTGEGREWAAKINATLTDPINIGCVGNGAWGLLNFTRNHNANVCFGCGPCLKKVNPPKVILLSVPEDKLTDGTCNCVQFAGDYTLSYKIFMNYLMCVDGIACGWQSDLLALCGDGSGGDIYDPCGPGQKWQIYMDEAKGMTLWMSNAYTIGRYYCAHFDCSIGATNTWIYNCPVDCVGACVSVPSTLTTFNQS